MPRIFKPPDKPNYMIRYTDHNGPAGWTMLRSSRARCVSRPAVWRPEPTLSAPQRLTRRDSSNNNGLAGSGTKLHGYR
jgi:hypothetical protein